MRVELGEVDQDEVLKSSAWHRAVALKCEPCSSDDAGLSGQWEPVSSTRFGPMAKPSPCSGDTLIQTDLPPGFLHSFP